MNVAIAPFIVSNDSAFTTAQKVVTYTLSTSSGGSVASYTWLSFSSATLQLTVTSDDADEAGLYSLVLKGVLADPYSSETSANIDVYLVDVKNDNYDHIFYLLGANSVLTYDGLPFVTTPTTLPSNF